VTAAGNFMAANFFGYSGYLSKLAGVPGSTLVVITFDEGEPTSSVITSSPPGNTIYTLMLAYGTPSSSATSMSIAAGQTCNAFYSHYGLLELIEDNWSLGNLGRNDNGGTASTYVSDYAPYHFLDWPTLS
jgi:hypothetical protein